MIKIMATVMVALIITACTPDKQANHVSADPTHQLKLSLDSLFLSHLNEKAPGAAVLVSYKGKKLMSKGYGLRDLSAQTLITPTTNMRMASVSKQFTALAILRLVDQGLLRLEDPLTKYWPYAAFEGITIIQLINHTSGIADYESFFMEEWDRSKIVENKDILSWLETNPKPLFAPGTKFEYSNTAYLVLALLVEKVSGQEFSVFAKEQVFEEAGMTRTNYFNLAKPIDIPERAYCYEQDSLGNWKQYDHFFLNGVMGDGAVYTSIDDYFTYDQAIRNQSILSDSLHQLLHRYRSIVPKEEADYFFQRFSFLKGDHVAYGMGWFITESHALHTGGWYGTRTIVVRDLKRPLTITIFLNSSQSFETLINAAFQLVDHYLAQMEQSLSH